jgi:hypothetical protein
MNTRGEASARWLSVRLFLAANFRERELCEGRGEGVISRPAYVSENHLGGRAPFQDGRIFRYPPEGRGPARDAHIVE